MGKKDQGEKNEGVSIPKAEYEKFLAQTKELEELREKLLRSAADYDNAKKRLVRDREEFVRFSQEQLIREILPILDNFERALQHSEETGAVAAGVQLIWKQLLDLLSNHGLKRFSSEGQPFDPHFHEAVDQVEEEGPDHVILKELIPGYQLHDRVLRPAKVRIRVHPRAKEVKTEEKEEEIT